MIFQNQISFTTVIENFFPLDEETFKENGFIVEDDRICIYISAKKMEDFHQKPEMLRVWQN